MKTENNNVPLYKVLNEQRTQGEWVTFENDEMAEHEIIARPAPDDGGDIIFEAPVSWPSSMSRWKPNSEYTALAVNNLHLLAEALQRLLKEARFNPFTLNGNVEDTPAERQAQEALNRIS